MILKTKKTWSVPYCPIAAEMFGDDKFCAYVGFYFIPKAQASNIPNPDIGKPDCPTVSTGE